MENATLMVNDKPADAMFIELSREQVESQAGVCIAKLHVKDKKGLIGNFSFHVAIKNGRPEASVVATKNKDVKTCASAVADWRRPSDSPPEAAEPVAPPSETLVNSDQPAVVPEVSQ